MSHTDLLDQLADIPVDSSLAAARAKRDAATVHTQKSYLVLFDAADTGDLAQAERLELARQTAQWHGDTQLAGHYAERLQQAGGVQNSPRLQAGIAYAAVLASHPLQVQPEAQQVVRDAGWSVSAFVTLSQIVAFVSYQTRLLSGYQLILERGEPAAAPVPAGDWHRHERTRSGQPAPTAFTQEELVWEAWLPAPSIEELPEPTRALLSDWKLLDHPYFRLLSLDLPILVERRLADVGIFFTQGGLPRAERELAAAVTSKVNGCIYCASVHARRATQLAHRGEDVQRVLDVQPGASLSVGQEELWAEQIDFAASLASTPAKAGADQIKRLRELGLDDLQLLDLVQSVAFFSWANRLMLSLGEPYWPAR